MSIKVFQTNSSGKIEFTRSELEKLLNEIYKEGFREGEEKAKNNHWTWTAPTIRNPIYCDATLLNKAETNVRAMESEPSISVTTTNSNANTDEVMTYGCSGIGKQTNELSVLADRILEKAFGMVPSTQLVQNKTPVNGVFADLEKEVCHL